MAPTYQTLVQISGTRNGVDWPRPGELIELPEAEAADYLAAGLIGPLEEETATPPKPETATKRRRGSAKQRAAQAKAPAAPSGEPPTEPSGEPGDGEDKAS